MKRRKYYPNNWQAIKDCPANYFPPMEYEELKAWKIHGYQLPSSHYGIVRIEDKDTGKITEHTYKSEHHTKMRLKKEIGTNKHITLATDEGVYHLIPNPLNIDFNSPDAQSNI